MSTTSDDQPGAPDGPVWTGENLLGLEDLSAEEITAILDQAAEFKSSSLQSNQKLDLLDGVVVANLFFEPSTRTRLSFESATQRLGGGVITAADMRNSSASKGESLADTVRVVSSSYADILVLRHPSEGAARLAAKYSSVPVINGLTDRSHPCQIVADLLTVIEHGKALPGLELAWLGDGNNVLHSVLEAAALMKFNVRIGTPKGYEPETEFVDMARAAGSIVTLTNDADEAIAGADVVVTDTWVSMGQDHAHNKLAAMAPFQVSQRLMSGAKPDAKFLHCLPAHVGDEVTEEVFEGPQSVVFDEAENRIHAQKSVLLWCFDKI